MIMTGRDARAISHLIRRATHHDCMSMYDRKRKECYIRVPNHPGEITPETTYTNYYELAAAILAAAIMCLYELVMDRGQ